MFRFIDSDTLYMLKNDIKNNVNNYYNNNTDWIYEYTKNKNCLIPVNGYKLEEFSLKISDNPEKDDLENIKIIYSNMINLSDSAACDERIWSGLCHDKFLYYMQKRWPLSKAKNGNEELFIKNHYFFGHGEIRSLLTNGLSRLWWYGRLTYDETLKNPFELTEFLARDINGVGFMLFGSNFSNNKNILKTYIKTLIQYEKENNITLKRDVLETMRKTMCLWGGKMLLDCLPEEILEQKISNKLNEILKKVDVPV